MEPTSFTVKEEAVQKGGKAGFSKTKLMTRLTYTLDEVGFLPGLCSLLACCMHLPGTLEKGSLWEHGMA